MDTKLLTYIGMIMTVYPFTIGIALFLMGVPLGKSLAAALALPLVIGLLWLFFAFALAIN